MWVCVLNKHPQNWGMNDPMAHLEIPCSMSLLQLGEVGFPTPSHFVLDLGLSWQVSLRMQFWSSVTHWLFHLLSSFPPIVNWYSTYLIYLTYLLVVVAGLVVLVGLVVVVMDVVAVATCSSRFWSRQIRCPSEGKIMQNQSAWKRSQGKHTCSFVASSLIAQNASTAITPLRFSFSALSAVLPNDHILHHSTSFYHGLHNIFCSWHWPAFPDSFHCQSIPDKRWWLVVCLKRMPRRMPTGTDFNIKQQTAQHLRFSLEGFHCAQRLTPLATAHYL